MENNTVSGTDRNIYSELKIGTHLSSAKGYIKMARDAARIGANTFQIFIRNPRGARARSIKNEEIEQFQEFLSVNGFGQFLAHAPYTLNLCSKSEHLRELSEQMLKEDLQRMELMPGNLYNLHPGNSMGQSVEAAAGQIAGALNRTMFPGMKTDVLLETMAGKGSEVGRRFEELKLILDKVNIKNRIGICMDACHMWDSGYDIVNRLDGVLEEFDHIIGLKYLKAFHINDSMNGRGSHKDRHTLLGRGCMGENAVLRIINHPSLYRLPFILETPTDLDGHAREIQMLKENYQWSGNP